LKSVLFNTNLEIISDYAFNNCKKLKQLSFKDTKPIKIYDNTWKNLPKDIVITVPVEKDSFLLSLNLEKKISEIIIDAELTDSITTNNQVLLPLIADNIKIPEVKIPIYQIEKPKEIEIPQRVNTEQKEITPIKEEETIQKEVSVKENQVIAKEDTISYAKVEIEKYTIEVTAEDKTMGNVSGSGLYEPNTEVTIKAEPFNGYQFIEWTDGEKENPRKVILTEKEQNYTAKFSLIENITPIEQLTCYPNPTRGVVYLSKKAKQIEVLNTAGQLIISFENQSIIDISVIPSGTYNLRVTTNEGVQTLKVILQK
jgi:hypothetical protein